MMTTALQVSRFLQGVGNSGLLCAPVARRMTKRAVPVRSTGCSAPARIVEEATARKLMAAMIDTIKRGTATRIASSREGIRAIASIEWFLATWAFVVTNEVGGAF